MKRGKFTITGTGLASGIVMGVGLGIALDSLAIGIALGMALGLCFEPGFAAKDKRDDQPAPKADQ